MIEFGWTRHQAAMLAHFETSPENFATPWRWSTIEATCYVGPGLLLTSEVGEMREAGVDLPDWSDDGDEPNLLHQRYHLWRWQRENPALDLRRLRTIQEFGGGYGAMAIVAARLGFRGEYHIHDLVEFEHLQDRHLPLRDLPFKVRHKVHKHPDLLISCFGLNEAPVEDRTAFLDRCLPENYLIACGGSVDPWFVAWAQRHFMRRGPVWVEQPGPIGAPPISYLLSHRGRK